MKDDTPWIEISKLKPHPDNPRQHDTEQIKKIARSIKELDWGRPIIISTDNYILAGHGAYLAAKNILRLDKVPYRRMKWNHQDPEALSYMVADNKLTDESDWNYAGLKTLNENIELQGFDVTLTGFDDVELKEIETKATGKKEVKEDDFTPEETEEPISKPGDLWQLGRHRLLCGDATKWEDVGELVGKNKIDMVFTDPPYDFDKDELIAETIDSVTENSHIFIMHDDKGIVNYLRNSNFNFNRFFVLDIKIASPRGNDPYLRHILVSHEKKGNPIKHENLHDGLSSIIPVDYRKNLKEDRIHDHQKSIESIAKFIKHYSKAQMNVLDLFGGSGSTLIACQQLDRTCYMMELEPKNCDIIIQRYQEFTGEKAEKI